MIHFSIMPDIKKGTQEKFLKLLDDVFTTSLTTIEKNGLSLTGEQSSQLAHSAKKLLLFKTDVSKVATYEQLLECVLKTLREVVAVQTVCKLAYEGMTYEDENDDVHGHHHQLQSAVNHLNNHLSTLRNYVL